MSEPLDPAANPEHSDLMKRFARWLKAYGAEHGFHIDAGVTADAARILRPAGSLNFKAGQPKQVETLQHDALAVTTFAEADALLPPLESTRAHSGAQTPTSRASAPRTAPENDTRVGTRIAHELPVTALLPLLGFTEGGAGRWGCDFISSDSALSIYSETGSPERASIWSEKVARLWRVDTSAPLTSWQMLAQVICGGSWKDAALVARAFDGDDDWNGLLSAVTENVVVSSDGQVDGSALIAEATSRRSSQPPQQHTTSFTDMLTEGEPGQMSIGPRLFVRYAPGEPHRHGTWTVNYEDVDGSRQRREHRLCDYILWRPAMSTELSVDEMGRTRPTSDAPMAAATFTVEVVRWDGQRVALPGFDSETSVHPAKVLAALNAGVLLPESRSGIEALANCLRVLGHDEQVRDVAYTAAGWTYVDDSENVVYLAPAGSVRATGTTHEYVIAPPPGSQRDALSECQEQFGFPDLAQSPEELREAAEAVTAFLTTTPSRPEVGMALLGVQFAAPLHASRRTTVALVARSDTGKSLLADACQSFVSGTTPGARRFPIDIPKSTMVGAALTQAWYRDAVPIADDYRITGNPLVDQKATNILETLVQNAYASGAPVKGTRSGGLRRAPSAISGGLVTAETTPTQMAIVTRTVTIEITPSDFPTTQPAPIDVFREHYAKPGLARAVMGDYIRWLAQRIDNCPDGLAGLRAEVDAEQSDRMRGTSGRSNETVSVLRVGWHYALLWAQARGIDDLLPSEAEVDAAFRKLTDANAEQHAKRSPGEALLHSIADMVAGGEGYLTSFEGRAPSEPGKFGWKRTNSSGLRGEGWEPVDGKALLGLLSRDEAVVFVTKTGVRAAARRIGLGTLKTEQVADYLQPYVVVGTTYGGMARVSDGFSMNRPRGAAFTVERLFLRD